MGTCWTGGDDSDSLESLKCGTTLKRGIAGSPRLELFADRWRNNCDIFRTFAVAAPSAKFARLEQRPVIVLVLGG